MYTYFYIIINHVAEDLVKPSIQQQHRRQKLNLKTVHAVRLLIYTWITIVYSELFSFYAWIDNFICSCHVQFSASFQTCLDNLTRAFVRKNRTLSFEIDKEFKRKNDKTCNNKQVLKEIYFKWIYILYIKVYVTGIYVLFNVIWKPWDKELHK